MRNSLFFTSTPFAIIISCFLLFANTFLVLKSLYLVPSLLFPSSYAFGLEETHYYSEAEKVAREAIRMQRKTPFACHVIGEVSGHAHFKLM